MKNKNILITGVNGFVGKNCLEYFAAKNNVYGIDAYGEYKNKNILISNVECRNIEKFNVNFDLIIHLAGSGSVGAAQKDPKGEKEKTIDSIKEVLSFIKNCAPNTRLIYSSSASVYGNDYDRPIKESDALNPVSQYGLHKVEAEKLLKLYSDEYNLDIKIIRFFSLYGIGCKKQLLFDVLNRIKDCKTNVLNCYGTGKEERDFVNIKDAVKFIEIVSKQKRGFEIYNCASSKIHCVEEIIDILISEYGKNIRQVYDNIEREGNPKTLWGDISKAKNIGFITKTDLKEGIREYVEWFKNL